MNQLFGNMPPVVKNLLILNILFFIAQFAIPEYTWNLALFPFHGPGFKPWQLATHFFMHGSIMHIFFNMFALVLFGSRLEYVWGPKRFLLYYFLTALGAALLHMLVSYLRFQTAIEGFSEAEVQHIINEGYQNMINGYAWENPIWRAINAKANTPVLGASGAVFGILAGFAYLFPNTELNFMFIPVPIKAKFFVLGYALLELYLGFNNSPGDRVAHFAHLGGAIVGLVIVLIWQRNKNQFY